MVLDRYTKGQGLTEYALIFVFVIIILIVLLSISVRNSAIFTAILSPKSNRTNFFDWCYLRFEKKTAESRRFCFL